MPTEYCDILLTEPDRFIDYILADSRARTKIVDIESFAKIFGQVLESDDQLIFLRKKLQQKGESLEMCGKNIFNHARIQRIVKGNVGLKEKQIRARVKKQKPKLKGKALEKEVQRRLNISIKSTGRKKLKQITIDESLQPVRVDKYERKGVSIKSHRKTAHRPLTRQEKMLITNGIKKGKSASQVIQNYYDSGLKFRSKESIRKHYYRVERKS